MALENDDRTLTSEQAIEMVNLEKSFLLTSGVKMSGYLQVLHPMHMLFLCQIQILLVNLKN